MAYVVNFTPAARRELRKLPREAQERVVPRTEALADEPRPPGCERISGATSTYRIRIGSYRVVYEVRDRNLLVLVTRVAHRGQVYRDLS